MNSLPILQLMSERVTTNKGSLNNTCLAQTKKRYSIQVQRHLRHFPKRTEPLERLQMEAPSEQLLTEAPLEQLLMIHSMKIIVCLKLINRRLCYKMRFRSHKNTKCSLEIETRVCWNIRSRRLGVLQLYSISWILRKDSILCSNLRPNRGMTESSTWWTDSNS